MLEYKVVDPFNYDASTNTWNVIDANEFSKSHLDNIYRIGQPFDPEDRITGVLADSTLGNIDTKQNTPTVHFQKQSDLLVDRVGTRINFDDFDIVKHLEAGLYDAQLDVGRAYSLTDLQDLGISPQSINDDGRDYGDHAQGATAYPWAAINGDIYAGGSPDVMYMFGSSRFQISQDTTFTIEQSGSVVVNGKIELQYDDFDFESRNVDSTVNNILKRTQVGGEDGKVNLTYGGEGAVRSYSTTTPSTPDEDTFQEGSFNDPGLSLGARFAAFSKSLTKTSGTDFQIFTGSELSNSLNSIGSPSSALDDFYLKLDASTTGTRFSFGGDIANEVVVVPADFGLSLGTVVDDTAPTEENSYSFGGVQFSLGTEVAVRPNSNIDASLQFFGGAMNHVSPLVLDLDGDGVAADVRHIYDDGTVFFDIDADGFAERVGWVGPDDGQLAMDRNGNGLIDDITELYGDDEMPAFVKLGLHDSDGDGFITNADDDWDDLLVWRDLNQDGVSQADELKSLDHHGITSISYAETSDNRYVKENYISGWSTFVKDGQNREIADVHYLNDNVNTWELGAESQVFGATTELNIEALLLPLSRGYGSLPALHLAMTRDDELRGLVRELDRLPLDELGRAADLTRDILLKWAGVLDNDPDARATGDGSNIDSRLVDFMEIFSGVEWAQRGSTGFVGENASLGIKVAWQGIHATLTARMVAQGPLEKVIGETAYDFATDTLNLTDDLDTIAARAADWSNLLGAEEANAFWILLGDTLVALRDSLGETVEDINLALTNAAGFDLLLGSRALADEGGVLGGLETDTVSDLFENVRVGTHQGDTINGGGGGDAIFGDGGSDIINGMGGDDIIVGGTGSDTLDGGVGDDVIDGGDGVDMITGGEGNDDLDGDAGDDTLIGGAGDDDLGGGAGADILHGGEGKDRLAYGSSNAGVTIDLAAGTGSGGHADGDVFSGFENVQGSEHNDIIRGDAGTNLLNGENGNDILEGRDGDDVLFGATGDDTLRGGNGDDILSALQGREHFDGGAGQDLVSYKHGFLSTGVHVDLSQGRGFAGEAHDDTYTGVENVTGSRHNDILIGDGSANYIRDGGGHANDVLRGGGGVDWLITTGGFDRLWGDGGGDRFRIQREDGDGVAPGPRAVVVVDFDGSEGDLIDLRDLPISTLVLQRMGNDTYADLGGGRALVIRDVNPGALNASHFAFPDGASMQVGPVKTNVPAFLLEPDVETPYAAPARFIDGNPGANTLAGDGGDDTLLGRAGDDRLIGNGGADRLDGGAGIDTVDYLSSWAGVNIDLALGTGSGGDAEGDVLVSIEHAVGSHYDDVIAGNSADNRLNGLSGSDTLIGNDGSDTLIGGDGDDDLRGGNGDDLLVGGSGADSFDGGAGTDQALYNNAASSITLDLENAHRNRGEAEGDVFTNVELFVASNHDDRLYGNAAGNQLYGLEGDDVLEGRGGTDTLVGGSGNDTLRGGSEDDYLFGGKGADILDGGSGANDFAQYSAAISSIVASLRDASVNRGEATGDTFFGIEHLAGSAHDDELYGNNKTNVLNGGDGNDILDGGAGQDHYTGGLGADTFVHDGGRNQDVIYDFNPSQGDRISFFGSSDVTSLTDLKSNHLLQQGSNLFVVVGSKAIFQINNANASYLTSTSVTFTALAGLNFTDTFEGSDGADHLIGSAYGDILLGFDGTDILEGKAGDDILEGGAGVDTLEGGAGNDTLDAGEGVDSVGLSQAQQLRGGTGDDIYLIGANAGDVLVDAAGEDQNGGNDRVEFTDVSLANAKISTFASDNSADGDMLAISWQQNGLSGTAYFAQSGSYIEAYEFADGLTLTSDAFTSTGVSRTGASSDDTVGGSAGDDVLNGEAGNDTLDGNTGDDLLLGAGGEDTLNGGEGRDQIFGGIGNDLVNGGLGNDTLNGGEGNDTIFGDEGNDIIFGGDGDDTINSGSGNDNVDAGDGADIVEGGLGNDLLNGGTGIDTLLGGAGNDTLDAEDGTDGVYLLQAQILRGGTGDDIYRISANAGDVVIDAAGEAEVGGTDRVEFYDLALSDITVSIWDSGNAVDGVMLTLSWNKGGQSGTAYFAQLGSRVEVFEFAGGQVIPISEFIESGLVRLGTDGTDNLIGSAGADTLEGGSGDDLLKGFGGADVLDGGNGYDQLSGGQGDDILKGGADDDVLFGEEGDDGIQGGNGEDTLNGGLGNDTLNGGEGNDTFMGGEGDDTVFGQDGNDIIDGGAGNDVLRGNFGDDTINGGAGDDFLAGSGGSDLITGGAGNDTGYGGDGDDILQGGTGEDSFSGNDGNDVIEGGDSDDTLFGNNGADTLLGGQGDDFMGGGGGNDILSGEDGNDTMFGGSNDDVLHGGEGNDRIEGQQQNDDLFGQNGNDILRGGDGSDLLDGGAGNDVLAGGNGGDILIGGLGADILRGNAGFDTFVFNNTADSTLTATDEIDGIERIGLSGGDVINLSGMDANIALVGDDGFAFLGELTSAQGIAQGAGSLWVKNVGSHTMVYGLTDDDSTIDFAVRINDGAEVSASDYLASDFLL
ncbi:Ca2+-binding protein, RTX toxin-related [Roseobacter denitrificans OCh 114]|nr:Ca2+-binding protein, RTX toxin-related [Roseobacter denitrificans OCh 114]